MPEEPAYGLILRHDIEAFDVPVEAQHVIWVNVHVPWYATPGVYTGYLILSADGVRPRRIGVRGDQHFTRFDVCVDRRVGEYSHAPEGHTGTGALSLQSFRFVGGGHRHVEHLRSTSGDRSRVVQTTFADYLLEIAPDHMPSSKLNDLFPLEEEDVSGAFECTVG